MNREYFWFLKGYLIISLSFLSVYAGLLPQKLSSLFKMSQSQSSSISILSSSSLPSWDILTDQSHQTLTGKYMLEQLRLREQGQGLPHTDAKIRLFHLPSGSQPRVKFYRDTAAWCPYCQKVWMLLEEKKIPYVVEKINMRSYGDKSQEYLRLVPNGLLPAIMLDGKFQTESLDIMLNLDVTFSGPEYPAMWPSTSSPEYLRAKLLMRLERDLFGRWCDLVFRPSMGTGARKRFEDGLDNVNRELEVTDGPWFLSTLSIVDLTYLSHIERMCASTAFWTGLKIRGSRRWPAIDRWFDAFEERPSYLATKSDYYTHVCDIPPQYGPGYSVPGSETFQKIILGQENSWKLPLPSFQEDDLEPISSRIDPGEEGARHEAAFKLIRNHENILKFSLRGAGEPGKKRFQAPLADPYAIPALEFSNDMDLILRQVSMALLVGYNNLPEKLICSEKVEEEEVIKVTKNALIVSVEYLRDRIGVPRDMSYPAARQLRAYLNWVIDTNLM